MSVVMSGLDCHQASIALRERLAFSRQQGRSLLVWLRQQPGGVLPPAFTRGWLR